MTPSSTAVERTAAGVRLGAGADRTSAAQLYRLLCDAAPAGGRVILEVEPSVRVDAVMLAAIVAAGRGWLRQGVRLAVQGSPAAAAAVAHRLAAADLAADAPSQPALARVGQRAYVEWAGARALVASARDSLADLAAVIVRKRHMPRGAVSQQVLAVGTDGAGVVALLAFLLGMIMAFEAAGQLGPLGAMPLVADVVGLSLVREFAPLLTGIVVIGRSGAAVASELASMKVDQEVAALRTMGIRPTTFLVSARLLGIMIAEPILTLLAGFVGLFGAMLTSAWVAHIDPLQFYERLVASVSMSDVWYGMSKGLAFAAATGLASCAVGLHTRGSAAEVGRATTRAVVVSIFLLVVLDSIFAVTSDAVLG